MRFERKQLILTAGTPNDRPEVVSWQVVWEKVR
jgi:hypothetical protein